MPAILRRTLVVLLALRAVAAPVVLPTPPILSHHEFFVVRMRCWPLQQLQRFSASSKLLLLYTGKNRISSGDKPWLLACWPLCPVSQTLLAAPVSRASTALATNRLAVCLRC